MADDSRNIRQGVINRQGAIESYAAIGDSFTEGVGDPALGGTFVGWADRFAVILADQLPDPETAQVGTAAAHGHFRYANLAVRGRLLDQIVEEQVPRAKELAPDLVSFCAGGNDIIRPGTDPDDVAERFERAVAELTRSVGTVLVTTGFDTRGVPVLRHLRGKIATYTAHVRSIADRYDCPVLDLWSLRSVQDRRAWDGDRLHLSPEGTPASRCAPPRSWASTCRPTPTRSGRRRRTERWRSGATTSTGPASTWCRGSGADCAASRRGTTWRRSGRTCCRSEGRSGQSSPNGRRSANSGEGIPSSWGPARSTERGGRAGTRSSTPPANTSYSGSVSRWT